MTASAISAREKQKRGITLNYDECSILMQALDLMKGAIPQMRKWDTFLILRERIYNEMLSKDDGRERMGL